MGISLLLYLSNITTWHEHQAAGESTILRPCSMAWHEQVTGSRQLPWHGHGRLVPGPSQAWAGRRDSGMALVAVA